MKALLLLMASLSAVVLGGSAFSSDAKAGPRMAVFETAFKGHRAEVEIAYRPFDAKAHGDTADALMGGREGRRK